jgi:hypothetical protein
MVSTAMKETWPVVGDGDGLVRIWHAKKGRCVALLDAQMGWPSSDAKFIYHIQIALDQGCIVARDWRIV